MEDTYNISSNYNMLRLKKYLNYEISTSVLYFLSFQVFVFIFLASVAAIIFMPFMLYVLVQEKKNGWIFLFAIIVIIPTILLISSAIWVEFSRPLLFIALGLFYFFCFLLRFEVNDWSREMSARHQFLLDKKKREDEIKIFNNRY